MVPSFLLFLLVTFVACKDDDHSQEGRRLPPEPEKATSSQVRDVSDLFGHNFDDEDWPVKSQNRKGHDRQVDKSAASQLSQDRITALFGAEARPAYGHRDPETGKVNLSPDNIQDRKGMSKSEEVDRVDDDITEPENNEINPFQLFPPSFHDLLNIPIHDYGNGSTLNPYEKFNKKPKQPLISSGYANTKLQGGKSNDGQDDSYEEHTQPPTKKPRYRTTTANSLPESDFEPTKRPVKQRRPVKPKPTPKSVIETVEHSDDFSKKETRNPYEEEARTEEVPVYVTTRAPIRPSKRPKPVEVDSFEDVRTYSRPYDEERYPKKPQAKRPEATTFRGESYSNVQMPKYDPKRPTSDESYFDPYEPKVTEPEPAPKRPQPYDDDIIYDYDDERNTGDKAVYFHVSKPDSDILKDTNSHGLPPHATKQGPAIPSEEFQPVPGPRPKHNPQTPGSPSDVTFQRPITRPGINAPFQPDFGRPEQNFRRPEQEYRRPEQDSRRPEQDQRKPEQFKQDVRNPGFPSVFNNDSPFASAGGPPPAQRRPPGPPFPEKFDQPKPFQQPGPRRPQEGFQQPSIRPPQQRIPDDLRNPPQDGFERPHPQQGDAFYQRPFQQGVHRQDHRQPPREQSSGPFSSITNMFSSLFGRRSERKRRSVDELIMEESRGLPSIVKLDRSELTAINTLKEQVGPDQEGTPPHFYIYPPDGSDPVLVVGPVLDTDAPHVEGAELVHVEPVGEINKEGGEIAQERQDLTDPNGQVVGIRKPPKIDTFLQRRPEQQSLNSKAPPPSKTRSGVVFPKKKITVQQEVARKPVEAVLDPVNSELSIPENVGVSEEDVPEAPEESLTNQVSQAVRNTVKKLNPLQLLRSQKNGVVTPTGEPSNPALARPAKVGSVPDIPFAEPIRLIPHTEGQFSNQAAPVVTPKVPDITLAPQRPLLVETQKPATLPALFIEKTTSSPKTELVENESVETEAVTAKDEEEDNTASELPVAERYVRIPVKTQLSDKGVFIVEAAPVQEKIEDRADTISVQPAENALPQNQQPPPLRAQPLPSLPPLNLPSGILKQISDLRPPQDLAQPIVINQAPLAANKPPLFPPGSELPATVQDRPQVRLPPPPPLVQAKPQSSSSAPVVINSLLPKPTPAPVFFPPHLTVDAPKPVRNTTAEKFSSKFNPQSVKTFKVGPDGKPLNVARPPQAPTTEKVHTLPPGVTPAPPKLVDLSAPFIPSQQVSDQPPQDSTLEASVSSPLWLAVGGKANDKEEDKTNQEKSNSVQPGSPFIEIGGFVPITPPKSNS